MVRGGIVMSGDARYPRIQFRIGQLLDPLTARQDGARLSRDLAASRDLERYYAVLAAELVRVDLTEAEAMALIDALNGSLLDTTSYRLLWAEIDDALTDGLAEKWSIDGPGLAARLRTLSPAQTMAVIDAAERWWIIQSAADEGEGAVPAERERRAHVVGLLH